MWKSSMPWPHNQTRLKMETESRSCLFTLGSLRPEYLPAPDVVSADNYGVHAPKHDLALKDRVREHIKRVHSASSAEFAPSSRHSSTTSALHPTPPTVPSGYPSNASISTPTQSALSPSNDLSADKVHAANTERNLENTDALISHSNNDREIKELKQQGRLLHNRQAALDVRQRKNLHTERPEENPIASVATPLEDDMKKATELWGAPMLREMSISQGTPRPLP
ncbi:hypothetical protein F5X97DRAFT_322999 [Nemania serpens]|nr:hypothetical protein F5X97DRAFT_322999 [Nemania serpens]